MGGENPLASCKVSCTSRVDHRSSAIALVGPIDTSNFNRVVHLENVWVNKHQTIEEMIHLTYYNFKALDQVVTISLLKEQFYDNMEACICYLYST